LTVALRFADILFARGVGGVILGINGWKGVIWG